MMAPIQQQPAGWPAEELLNGMVADTGELAGLSLTGLSLDSRNTRSGDLFFACSGYQQHGLAFVHQAVAAGAVLQQALCWYWPSPQRIGRFSESMHWPENWRCR